MGLWDVLRLWESKILRFLFDLVSIQQYEEDVTCEERGRERTFGRTLADLQNEFGEIEWTNHARLVSEETSRQQRENIKIRKRVRHQSADLPDSDAVALASSVDSPRGPSTIDQLFSQIYDNIEKQDWENTKEKVQRLQETLQVTKGRESRSRGGWRYACDFILDTVLFSDLLCRLQDDVDVLTSAVNLRLGFLILSRFSVFNGTFRSENNLGEFQFQLSTQDVSPPLHRPHLDLVLSIERRTISFREVKLYRT